jgi:hypothetical protein
MLKALQIVNTAHLDETNEWIEIMNVTIAGVVSDYELLQVKLLAH